jgi:hypothetical protein
MTRSRCSTNSPPTMASRSVRTSTAPRWAATRSRSSWSTMATASMVP